MELAFRTRLPGKESPVQLPRKAQRQPPGFSTTIVSWPKATRRTSTLTRKASSQTRRNITHGSPAEPGQGRVTPTPSANDSVQHAPSYCPITDDSSTTRISKPNCATVNRLNDWPAQGRTRHHQTQLTQLGSHSSLPPPYRPSSDASPPTRSPLPSCTRGPPPPSGRAKVATRHCQATTTQLGTRPDLPLLYGPSSGASLPTLSPVPGCTGTCGASPQTPLHEC